MALPGVGFFGSGHGGCDIAAVAHGTLPFVSGFLLFPIIRAFAQLDFIAPPFRTGGHRLAGTWRDTSARQAPCDDRNYRRLWPFIGDGGKTLGFGDTGSDIVRCLGVYLD